MKVQNNNFWVGKICDKFCKSLNRICRLKLFRKSQVFLKTSSHFGYAK